MRRHEPVDPNPRILPSADGIPLRHELELERILDCGFGGQEFLVTEIGECIGRILI